MLIVATANVNGLRAAVRRGMPAWLEQTAPDVLCLQEVRAPHGHVASELGEGWFVAEAEASAKGRAGVAVASRHEHLEVRLDLPGFEGEGRWIEVDLAPAGTPITVISAYVHTGEADTPKQDDKYRFLERMRERMAELTAAGREALICGDLNVAHREEDLKNHKGNKGKAGFLLEERAWFDARFAEGWVDVGRRLAGDVAGPYTWWSWRGQAFDNDSGWRIDYQLATPGLGDLAASCVVGRAATYAERWSDHAPVVAEYKL